VAGIGDDELRSIRETSRDYLPQRCTIQETTNVLDDGGSLEPSVWTVARRVPCRIGPMTQEERAIYDRIASVGSWTITMPHDAPVTERSQIIVGSRTFAVVAVPVPRDYQLHVRVVVTEVR
jgi:head-tail adaptor